MLIMCFNFITGEGRKLVLCDSIPKYTVARDTEVKYFKGRTVSQLSDMVFFGQVDVSGYSVIYIHAGTNDINDLVNTGKIKHVLPYQVLELYQALRANIRRRNSSAIILISSIIPRLDNYACYDPLVRGINFCIEKWCAKSGGTTIFVPSWKWFVSRGMPIQAYYAKDGLHPNGAGNGALQAGIQQALVTTTMIERATSRRAMRLAGLPY